MSRMVYAGACPVCSTRHGIRVEAFRTYGPAMALPPVIMAKCRCEEKQHRRFVELCLQDDEGE